MFKLARKSFLQGVRNKDIQQARKVAEPYLMKDITSGEMLARYEESVIQGELDEEPFNRNALLCAVQNNQLDMVKYLVDEINCSVNMQRCRGYNALHVACIHNNKPMIDYLLSIPSVEVNCRTLNEGRQTPLMIALKNNHYDLAARLVRDYRAKVRSKDYVDEHYTVFQKCIAHGNLDLLLGVIVNMGRLPNDKTNADNDPNFFSHVQLAILSGNIQMLRLMVEFLRSDVYLMDANGSTCLTTCVRAQQFEMLRYLTNPEGSVAMDVNIQDKDGTTALHIACYQKNMQVIRYLVEVCHADIYIRDRDGIHPWEDTDDEILLQYFAMVAFFRPPPSPPVVQEDTYETETTSSSSSDEDTSSGSEMEEEDDESE